jgi:hypothetical protein
LLGCGVLVGLAGVATVGRRGAAWPWTGVALVGPDVTDSA